MDDPRCEQFFLEPCQALQRRYEALRAFFVQRQPLPDIARQFGLAHGTLRNLVCQFRARYQTGQVPPFSSNRHADDPAAPAPSTPQRVPRSPTLLIAAHSP
jgi:hypothetical protein